MGYLAYFISLVSLVVNHPTNMTFNQRVDHFLDQAVSINGWMFWICVAIWIITVLSVKITKHRLTGWLSVILLTLPIGQGLVWLMSSGIATSFSADAGVTDLIKFLGLIILTLIIGIE
jgi:hypothetical protein